MAQTGYNPVVRQISGGASPFVSSGGSQGGNLGGAIRGTFQDLSGVLLGLHKLSADAEERKKLWESKDKDREQKGDQYKTTRQDSHLVQMGNFARWMVERNGLEIREAEAKLRGNREEMNSIEDTIRALDSKESALLLVEDKEFTEKSDILKKGIRERVEREAREDYEDERRRNVRRVAPALAAFDSPEAFEARNRNRTTLGGARLGLSFEERMKRNPRLKMTSRGARERKPTQKGTPGTEDREVLYDPIDMINSDMRDSFADIDEETALQLSGVRMAGADIMGPPGPEADAKYNKQVDKIKLRGRWRKNQVLNVAEMKLGIGASKDEERINPFAGVEIEVGHGNATRYGHVDWKRSQGKGHVPLLYAAENLLQEIRKEVPMTLAESREIMEQLVSDQEDMGEAIKPKEAEQLARYDQRFQEEKDRINKTTSEKTGKLQEILDRLKGERGGLEEGLKRLEGLDPRLQQKVLDVIREQGQRAGGQESGNPLTPVPGRPAAPQPQPRGLPTDLSSPGESPLQIMRGPGGGGLGGNQFGEDADILAALSGMAIV